MRKLVSTICSGLFVALALGCGGGNTTSTATTTYTSTLSLAPANQQMGGAIQKAAPLALNATNAKVITWAGSSAAGLVNAIGTAARFYQPNGVTTNGVYVYVTDYLNNAIRRIDTTTGDVTTLPCTDKTSGAPIIFNRPADITTDGTNLYVVDTGSHTVRFIDAAFKVETIGSTTNLPGSVDSAVPGDVRFNTPSGITSDGVNLYVADSGNHTIRTINIASKAVTTLAGSPGATGSANGIQGAARFYVPVRITTDRKNLYITDYNNRTIRMIDIATGDVTTLAGIAGTHGTSDTASGVTATFYHPNGITTDGTYLYVTDKNDTSSDSPQHWNTIRKIDIINKTVTTIAGGISLTSPNSLDATGINSRFDIPVGITTDGTSLYVADSGNNSIRKIFQKLD